MIMYSVATLYTLLYPLHMRCDREADMLCQYMKPENFYIYTIPTLCSLVINLSVTIYVCFITRKLSQQTKNQQVVINLPTMTTNDQTEQVVLRQLMKHRKIKIFIKQDTFVPSAEQPPADDHCLPDPSECLPGGAAHAVKIAKKYLKATVLNLLIIMYHIPFNAAILYVYLTNSLCHGNSTISQDLVTALSIIIVPINFIMLVVYPWIVKKKLENLSKMTLRYW